MEKDKKYLIKYQVESGRYSKEELDKEKSGGSDQLGLISVIGDFFNGESLSLAFIGVKGSNLNTSWTDEEWFEAFTFLSNNLLNSKTLDSEKKAIAKETFEKAKEIKLRGRH